MERKTYHKLVRDKIPEIIRASGSEPDLRILDDADYKKFLRLKLVEEAGETNAAKTRGDLVKELGDLLEVMDALMQNEGITRAEVEVLKEKRRAERGGFAKRIYLISG